MNDLDEHYRRVSALDPSAPGAATRRAVLAHAAALATVPRARRRRHALWGSLAAAALAGALVIPQWRTPPQPTQPQPARPHDRAAAPSATSPTLSAESADSARSAAPAPAFAPAQSLDLAPTQGAAANGYAEIDARDAAGRSALLRASMQGDAATVALLLSRGADPNLADRNGLTPLQAAKSAGHAAVVDALRRAGAR